MLVNGVFKGGGAKGLAYVGALQACEERDISFGAVSGSSAGAITATLVACGYRSNEIASLMPSALATFDRPLIAALKLHRPALLSSRKLETWLDDVIAQRLGGRPKQTFDDLYRATGVDLFVVAMDLSTRQPVVFCRHLTPDFPVSAAVVASSSIPGAFPPYRVMAGGSAIRLVDGGVWANYPSFVFLDEDFRRWHQEFGSSTESRRTIGFILDDEARDTPRPGNSLRPIGTARAVNTDRGSAARELGGFGGIISSWPFRAVLVASPILMVLLFVRLSANQVQLGLPRYADLPDRLGSLPWLLTSITFQTLILAGFVLGFVTLRLLRPLTDTALVGTAAAMGVGPSVPYWVDQRAQPETTTHIAVRITVPRALSTLAMRPPALVAREAITTAYESTHAQLDSAGVGRPVSPAQVDLSTFHPSRFESIRNRIRVRVKASLAASRDRQRHLRPKQTAFQERLRPYAPELSWAVVWLMFIGLVPFTAVTILRALRDETLLSPTYVQRVIFGAGFALLIFWRYGVGRSRSASKPHSLPRRQRVIVLWLGVLAGVLTAMSLATLTFSSELPGIHVLTQPTLESTVTEVDLNRQAYVVVVQPSVETPCGPIDGERAMPFGAPGSNSHPGVGESVSLVVDPDKCVVWPVPLLEERLASDLTGYLVVLAVLVITLRLATTAYWKLLRNRDLHAITGATPVVTTATKRER